MPRGLRRRTARAVVAIALAVPVGALMACTPEDLSAQQTVTLSVAELDNPYFREMGRGAHAAADAYGVGLQILAARNDSARQAHQLRAAVRDGTDAVLVAPVDPLAAAAAVQPALNARVPVVAVDREVEGVRVRSTVTSDNVDGGRQVSEALVASVGSPAQVIHLQGDPATSASANRAYGFRQGLAPYDDITVVASQPVYFDPERARRVTRMLLKRYPEVDAIFAENDETALAAVEVLGNRAGSKVEVFGYDGIPAALLAIREGRMEATVAQDPEQIGRVAVEQAVTALDGGLVAPRVPVGVELVTAGNVSQYL